jgi:hypothetical protein
MRPDVKPDPGQLAVDIGKGPIDVIQSPVDREDEVCFAVPVPNLYVGVSEPHVAGHVNDQKENGKSKQSALHVLPVGQQGFTGPPPSEGVGFCPGSG